MATEQESKELSVREKELLSTEEGTREGIYFKPDVDIFETEESLTVVADVPGAKADQIEVDLRDNLLTITAATKSVEDRWQPVYAEYETGHFTRQFRVGQSIDQAGITARVDEGVLYLTLPKSKNAVPRRIEVK